MKCQSLLAAVLVLSAVGTAQVVTTFQTSKRNMIQLLMTAGEPDKRQYIEPNTNLKAYPRITVTNPNAEASLEFGFNESRDQIVMEIDSYAKGYHNANNTFAWATVDAEALFTITAPVKTKAALRLTWSWDSTSVAYSTTAVWINGEKRVDSRTSLGKNKILYVFPFDIRTTGSTIKVASFSCAGWPGYPPNSITNSLRLAIVPTSTTFQKRGVTCGPILSGTYGFGDQVTFSVAKAPAAGKGIMVLGTNQVARPIPGINCMLYTDPLAAIPTYYSCAGTWSLTQKVPLACRPFTVYAQVGAWGATFQTSNLLILNAPLL